MDNKYKLATILSFFIIFPLITSGENPKQIPKLDKDRKAILSMAGEYEVTFKFMETIAISDEYELIFEVYKKFENCLIFILAKVIFQYISYMNIDFKLCFLNISTIFSCVVFFTKEFYPSLTITSNCYKTN